MFDALRDRPVSISSVDMENAGLENPRKKDAFSHEGPQIPHWLLSSLFPHDSIPANSNFQGLHLRFKPLNAREENLPGI